MKMKHVAAAWHLLFKSKAASDQLTALITVLR